MCIHVDTQTHAGVSPVPYPDPVLTSTSGSVHAKGQSGPKMLHIFNKSHLGHRSRHSDKDLTGIFCRSTFNFYREWLQRYGALKTRNLFGPPCTLHIKPFSCFSSSVRLMPSSPGWGGSVVEWLACWTQAQKGLGSNCRRDAAG